MIDNHITTWKISWKQFKSSISSNIFLHKNVVNLFISYTLGTWSRNLNTDFTLGNCLYGAVKLAKNADSDKYGCSGYDIGFGTSSQFLLPDGSWGKNFFSSW